MSEHMAPPELSERFDVEDIRRLREYNSARHATMTAEEIVAETRAAVRRMAEWLAADGNLALAEKLGFPQATPRT